MAYTISTASTAQVVIYTYLPRYGVVSVGRAMVDYY